MIAKISASQIFYIKYTILLMYIKLTQSISNIDNPKLFKSAYFLRDLSSFVILLFMMILFSLALFSNQAQTQHQNIDLGVDDWHRTDRHDGYVTGNGHIYTAGGLGQKLTRSGKSFLSDESVSLTRLAWVNGPLYSVGKLGYGWELNPKVNGDEESWNSESVLSPGRNEPF
jgi:hypothetical protein